MMFGFDMRALVFISKNKPNDATIIQIRIVFPFIFFKKVITKFIYGYIRSNYIDNIILTINYNLKYIMYPIYLHCYIYII